MKNLLFLLVIALLLTGCIFQKSNSEQIDLLSTVVAATQNAISTLLPPPQVITPFKSPAPQIIITSTEMEIKVTTATIENPMSTAIPGISMPARCDELLIAQVNNGPEIVKDMFEHHARGVYLIVLLELENISDQAIQIWDEDYFIEATLNNKSVIYSPDKAATGYLFITRGNNLYQDLIQPFASWKSYLAFDVDPASQEYVLLIQPGGEIGKSLCEIRINLDIWYPTIYPDEGTNSLVEPYVDFSDQPLT